MHLIRAVWIVILFVSLQGCVGAAIDTASDAAIAVAKIPFKVAGAVVSGVKGDKKETKENENS